MLRLSEAAALLGIAPSTLRSYCNRELVPFRKMPNGERRFDRAALKDFRSKSEGQPAAGVEDHSSIHSTQRPDSLRLGSMPGRQPDREWREHTPPWERRARAAQAEVEVERASQELTRLREAEEQRDREHAAEQAEAQAALAEARRLTYLKRWGRSCILASPDLERSVIRDLDSWVTAETVPSFLNQLEQRDLVATYVSERIRNYGALGNERKRQHRSERERRTLALIRSGAEPKSLELNSTLAPVLTTPPVPSRPERKNGGDLVRQVQRIREDQELEAMERSYERRKAIREISRVFRG